MDHWVYQIAGSTFKPLSLVWLQNLRVWNLMIFIDIAIESSYVSSFDEVA